MRLRGYLTQGSKEEVLYLRCGGQRVTRSVTAAKDVRKWHMEVEKGAEELGEAWRGEHLGVRVRVPISVTRMRLLR